jgi:hypothetical protein
MQSVLSKATTEHDAKHMLRLAAMWSAKAKEARARNNWVDASVYAARAQEYIAFAKLIR